MHTVPGTRLLDLLSEEFSEDLLSRLERTLAEFVPLTDNGRVAAFVARKVCDAVSSMMGSTTPTVARDNAIEGHIREPLGLVIAKIANFQLVDEEDLASLIRASERARITI